MKGKKKYLFWADPELVAGIRTVIKATEALELHFYSPIEELSQAGLSAGQENVWFDDTPVRIYGSDKVPPGVGGFLSVKPMSDDDWWQLRGQTQTQDATPGLHFLGGRDDPASE